MTTDPKATLNTIASQLRTVHKLLLEYEKKIYEQTYGRVSDPYQLLNLAMEDPQFAWLRALSGEMVHLDEVRLNKEGVTPEQVRLIATRLRALFLQDRKQTSFQQHFEEARAEDPNVLMASSELLKSLPAAADMQVFVSAEEQTDPKEPVPGALRPGKLVPGHGDKGYYGLGAILETSLNSVPSRKISNESLLGVASEPAMWAAADSSVEADAWAPVIVRGGTGTDVSVKANGDGMEIGVFVRQQELGGDASITLGSVTDHDGWSVLGNPESLGNGVTVFARPAADGDSVDIPVAEGQDLVLFTIAGAIRIDGVDIPESHLALIRHPEKVTAEALAPTMILAIQVDPEATITRAGNVAR